MEKKSDACFFPFDFDLLVLGSPACFTLLCFVPLYSVLL